PAGAAGPAARSGPAHAGPPARVIPAILPAVLPEGAQFRLLFPGQVRSVIGDRITFVAIRFAVLAAAGASADAGLVAGAGPRRAGRGAAGGCRDVRGQRRRAVAAAPERRRARRRDRAELPGRAEGRLARGAQPLMGAGDAGRPGRLPRGRAAERVRARAGAG